MKTQLLKMVFEAMSYGNAQDRESARFAVGAALAEQPAPQEPVAWKLMPRDATDAMLKAMDECSTEGYDERLYAGHAASVYMAAWDVYPNISPQPKPVSHAVIAGALFDFMGWLTSRKERLVLSSADEASPAVDAIRDFAKMRGLSLDDAKVQDWNINPQPAQRNPLTDRQILADETLRYYFGQNGGAGPVSKQGRKVVDAIEAAHGIKENT